VTADWPLVTDRVYAINIFSLVIYNYAIVSSTQEVTGGSTTFQFHLPTEIMEIFFGQQNKSNQTIFPQIYN